MKYHPLKALSLTYNINRNSIIIDFSINLRFKQNNDSTCSLKLLNSIRRNQFLLSKRKNDSTCTLKLLNSIRKNKFLLSSFSINIIIIINSGVWVQFEGKLSLSLSFLCKSRDQHLKERIFPLTANSLLEEQTTFGRVT